MLSSYPVTCPYEGCGWGGNLVPSLLRGGADAEIGRKQRAWFHCPGCQRDWEVRISDDRVTVAPAAERGPGLGGGRNVARRKASVPMAGAPRPRRRRRPRSGWARTCRIRSSVRVW